MKKLILFIGTILTVFICHAQKIQTYSGPYVTKDGNNGHITYHYYDTEEYNRIYQGPINYVYDNKYIDSRGDCKLKAQGYFNKNLKDGPWTYQIIHNKGLSIETLKGKYKDGKMEGTWYDITIDREKNKTLVKSIIHLKHNKPIKDFYFYYRGDNYYNRSISYNQLEIKGQFNSEGQYDGEWRATYHTRSNTPMEMIQRYKNGVLYWEIHRNKANGNILSRINKQEFTEQFFNNLDSTTQISIVDSVKYILVKDSLRSKRFPHPIYYGLYFWTKKPSEYSYSNRYNVYNSIPSYMIEKGDLMHTEKHVPFSNIIKWEETPEGRVDLEYKEQMEYANTLLKTKSYHKAEEEYRKALKIKDSDEAKRKIDECKEEQLKAEQKQIDDKFNFHVKLANYLFTQEKYVVASFHYQKAIHIKEDPIISQKITECEKMRQHQIHEGEAKFNEAEKRNEINDKIAKINDNHQKLYDLYHPVSTIASEAAGTNIHTTKKKKLWNAYNLLYQELAQNENKRKSLENINTMLEIQKKINNIRFEKTRALEKALKNENNTDIIIQKIKES